MTSGTGSQHNSQLQLETRATAFQAAPTVALVITLLAAQYAGMALTVSASNGDDRVSTQLSATVAKSDLLQELLEFHLRLASSQKDLPEEAARVLRENLWQLYD